MPTYATFIIDDEPDAGQLLESLLQNFAAIQVKQVFTDSLKALDAVIMVQPPVIFLDIDMPEITGLEFLKQVNNFSPNTKVVFVTAHKDYALEALQNDAFDFICKPISKPDLRRVVHKIISALNTIETTSSNTGDQRVLLKTLEGHHYVAIDNVLYLEADSNYTYLVLKNGEKLLSSVNLGKVHELFPSEHFVRISRKHIINKNYLTFMNFNKRYCLASHNGKQHKLEVSVKMKELKRELE